MRKYYQAALLIIAILSLTSLLFYRHEYNKLRYVLEVFNYFGKPKSEATIYNCSKEIFKSKKLILDLKEPITAWQRLNNDLYFYSSYLINNNKIQTISYGKLKSFSYECKIYFSNQINPVPGLFSFEKITGTTSNPEVSIYQGYILNCEFSSNLKPVGVIYHQKHQFYNNNVSILAVKIQPQSLSYNGSAVCVIPPLSIPMSYANMVSFINFHELVGMNHFVIYDYGIPSEFHDEIKSIIEEFSPDWKFTYEVIPGNFPFKNVDSNVIRNIIQADCLYRTYNKVKYATTISWEEYIVLKYHHNIPDLLIDYKRQKMFGNRFAINTQTFCLQQKDDKRLTESTPVVLRKTKTTKSSLDSNLIYIYKPHEALSLRSIKTRVISSDLIVTNRYITCENYDFNKTDLNKYESSILRFAADMNNSPILKKFNSGKMFNSA